ncbi:D-alanyl-D-alanine carboxypeptidase [Aurantimonas sp. MSK8Z-1]|uniref:D-alanyl-D-alanine carboxypeptidase family protein n=1 Tax=Mangrovibrevibacter kandeliae TaxID=2968473 RepID=UPI002117CAC1|nr:D-alanyl-D-alanine carboxypeptidase family protein [Aurantimonas sp. MSK8Z-1]MCW4116701.1 D-alanyl-D-alanine carboxypeptidase [Aurantimonas sp. MSK8Z-1]
MRRFIGGCLIAVAVLPALWLDSAAAAPRLLVDVRTGQVLYADDAATSWYPASLTKLMVAHLVMREVEAGELDPRTIVTMSTHAASLPPSRFGLKPGSEIELRDALRIMLVRSYNDLAVAVAESVAGSEAAFVEAMNRECARLGMRGTHFVNANGLHDPGQVTTAHDMALLALAIMREHPQNFAMFGNAETQFDGRTIKNTNGLLRDYPGVDGMKTGYTCPSGFNLVATAYRGGRRLLAIAMGEPSTKARAADVSALFDAGFAGRLKPVGPLSRYDSSGLSPAVDLKSYACGKSLPAAALPLALTGG